MRNARAPQGTFGVAASYGVHLIQKKKKRIQRYRNHICSSQVLARLDVANKPNTLYTDDHVLRNMPGVWQQVAEWLLTQSDKGSGGSDGECTRTQYVVHAYDVNGSTFDVCSFLLCFLAAFVSLSYFPCRFLFSLAFVWARVRRSKYSCTKCAIVGQASPYRATFIMALAC